MSRSLLIFSNLLILLTIFELVSELKMLLEMTIRICANQTFYLLYAQPCVIFTP